MNENSKSLYTFLVIVLLGFVLIQVKRTGSSTEITENEIMGHIRYPVSYTHLTSPTILLV